MKIISEYSSLDYFAKNHVRYCHHFRSIVVVISFQISNSWMIPYKIYFFLSCWYGSKIQKPSQNKNPNVAKWQVCCCFCRQYNFVCKSHYIDCLIKELGIGKSFGNSTYTPKILDNHRSVLCSFGISTKNEELDLIGYIHLYICMHKCMYGYNYISRSAKYSMKSLSSWYLDPFYQQSKLDFRVTVGAIVVVIVW